jgi:hypothetical protein
MKLRADIHKSVANHVLLIKHHRELASMLERELHNLIRISTGIDIEHEPWQLDVEAGTLTKVEPPCAETTPPTS